MTPIQVQVVTEHNDSARILVYYARSDGKDVARELRDRFFKEGFKVWRNLAAMEGGRDRWRRTLLAVLSQFPVSSSGAPNGWSTAGTATEPSAR